MERSPGSQLIKSVDQEGQLVEIEKAAGRKKGGWITLPFIVGSVLGLGLATSTTTTNLVVYLIKEYNIESINATQISNIFRGSINLVPVAAAVVADSYSGCFPVAVAGTAINVLSLALLTLSATLPSLRPPHCAAPPQAQPAACQHASPGQLAVLYGAVCLLVVGAGATRFTIATLGADQFGSAREQDSFFSWFFVSLYGSFVVGDTAIIYLQDSVSWALGFEICLAATVASLAMLLLGARYYRMPAPKGSPYAGLLRVVVATARKARVDVRALGPVQYYVGDGAVADAGSDGAPTKMLRFLNRAAIVVTASDASASRLCTVQQVEDLKTLLGVIPVWSSSIFVSVSVAVNIGLIVLQALAMDRSLGPRFTIPAASVGVSSLVVFIAATPVLERAVFPLWRGLRGALPTPLQRVGLGHAFNIAAMVAAALVERQRLSVLRAHHGAAGQVVAPMSVLWLLIPLALLGVSEALHFPGNLAFCYQEFPKTLRSMGTAMAPLIIALGFYLSTVFVDVVRKVTAWLPANINQGRIDNVYWAVAAAAAINFGYFLVCACRYKSRNSSSSTVDEGGNKSNGGSF